MHWHIEINDIILLYMELIKNKKVEYIEPLMRPWRYDYGEKVVDGSWRLRMHRIYGGINTYIIIIRLFKVSSIFLEIYGKQFFFIRFYIKIRLKYMYVMSSV